MVTIVEGIDDTAIDINQLAKILKSLRQWGTSRDDHELQGEHKKRASQVLKKNGYQVEVR